MNKSIFTHLGLIAVWTSGLSLFAACTDTGEQSSANTGLGDSVSVEHTDGNAPQQMDTDTSEWISLQSGVKMIALENGCCETTGQANECWEKDIIADDVDGYILCKTDSDCAPTESCNTNVDLSAYTSIPDAGNMGLCTCATNGDADCQNASGSGGSCFSTEDPVTHSTVALCGPSICNGYYVCSCWGGCVWWDGNSGTNTPEDDAAILKLSCCESAEFANPFDTDDGFVLFGSTADCSDGGTTIAACTSDTDCTAADIGGEDACVISSCDTDAGRCSHIITTGVECDADSLGCTLDRCGADGICVFSGARCGPDATYLDTDGAIQPNTCVETCREDPSDTDSDSNTWVCNINLDEPSDASQDPDGICEWWSCESAGTFNEPVFHQTDCTALSAASTCYDYACDTDGSQGNCDDIIAIPAANDNCTTATSLGGFTSSDPAGASSRLSTYGDTRCATNAHHAGTALNCEAGSSSNPLGYGSWVADGSSGGKDLVYTFTYEASGSATPAYRYSVLLENLWNNSGQYWDGALYLSTSLASNGGCDISGSGPPYAVEAEDCDLLGNGKIQEDHCYTFTGTGYDSGDTFYECVSIEGSAEYEWAEGTGNAYYAKATLDEEAGYTGTVTVYVYVDADDGASGAGEFFLSVTKEQITDCPLPGTADFFYQGPVHRVMDSGTYNFAVPINGSDFSPVDAADQVQTGTLGVVTGVVVSGNTYTTSGAGNYYDPDGTDPVYDSSDPYAWNGYDEAWELDIQTDGVRFAASLCDYGGSYDITPGMAGNVFNPMVGIFNCHGERIDFNDDSWECGTQGSQIRPTSAVDISNGPYYIIVDGKYEPPGSAGGGTGNPVGNSYDLSIFYQPVVETTCPLDTDSDTTNDTDTAVADSISGTFGRDNNGNVNDRSDLYDFDYATGCVFLEPPGDSPAFTFPCLELRSNGIGYEDTSGNFSNLDWKCYDQDNDDDPTEYWQSCADPMIFMFTYHYSSSTVPGLTCTYSDWLASYDGHLNDIGPNNMIEYLPVHPDTPECDILDGLAIRVSFNPLLDDTTTPTLQDCYDNCGFTDIFYVTGRSSGC